MSARISAPARLQIHTHYILVKATVSASTHASCRKARRTLLFSGKLNVPRDGQQRFSFRDPHLHKNNNTEHLITALNRAALQCKCSMRFSGHLSVQKYAAAHGNLSVWKLISVECPRWTPSRAFKLRLCQCTNSGSKFQYRTTSNEPPKFAMLFPSICGMCT